MEYPFVGQVYSAFILFYDEGRGLVLGDALGLDENVNVGDLINISGGTNITREYLEGKCVKIESPEHSEFIIKLAENAEFMQYEGDFTGNYKNGDFLFFYGDNDITCAHGNTKGWEEITIPLPPKEEPEPKEWAQIGDKVCYGNGVNCEVTGIHNEVAMILTERGDYHIAYLSELKKPKSEVEILLEDLRAHFEKYTFQDQAINELHLKFNITKKPQ